MRAGRGWGATPGSGALCYRPNTPLASGGCAARKCSAPAGHCWQLKMSIPIHAYTTGPCDNFASSPNEPCLPTCPSPPDYSPWQQPGPTCCCASHGGADGLAGGLGSDVSNVAAAQPSAARNTECEHSWCGCCRERNAAAVDCARHPAHFFATAHARPSRPPTHAPAHTNNTCTCPTRGTRAPH